MSWERQVCIKSADELKIMREAGVINAKALKAAADACVPGNSTWDVNAAADAVLKKYHVVSAFKGVPGPIPYPASTCVSVNNILVHGIPAADIDDHALLRQAADKPRVEEVVCPGVGR